METLVMILETLNIYKRQKEIDYCHNKADKCLIFWTNGFMKPLHGRIEAWLKNKGCISIEQNYDTTCGKTYTKLTYKELL